MNSTIEDRALLSLPMGAVLLAQFFSAFADNALLITAIALVKSQGHLGWIPLLQAFFVIPFILLAPFVGALADAFPKGRVMLFANGLKLTGAASMAAGLHPLLANCLRLTVGSPEENDALIQALKVSL